jgi:phytoene dehydrogenase-like protein
MQMSKSDNQIYDAVIIGAGLSGLVCGCYLAKAGMKVLISEQHYKPGGYCTSFKRQGFAFDAAAHCFGGYRRGGIIRQILEELEIDNRILINRFDPSDIITTPDYKLAFWSDLDKTVSEFQEAFPEEGKNIRTFFNFLITPDPKYFAGIRGWTFRDLLDKYFTSDKLKAILSFPLLGNGGLPASLMSAFVGSKIFTEVLLDGGYYPEKGMQTLPDVLTERFTELGGEVRLSSLVTKIKVKERTIKGVVLGNREYVPAKYVISNCDARQTFLRLLGREVVSEDFLNKIKRMTPSLSMFILYLGVDQYDDMLPIKNTNNWFLYDYSVENVYRSIKKGSYKHIVMLRVMPDSNSIIAFVNAPFKSKRYWESNKNKLLEAYIMNIEKQILPDLSKHIIYKDAASPATLQRYTLNYQGSAYGWASTPSQLADHEMRKPNFLKGLYLSSHWTTEGLGIPGVFYIGRDTSKILLRIEKKTHII